MVVETPAAIDAWTTFLHTRSAVTSARYPWRIDYTIAISGLDGAKAKADHYRASCNPNDGSIRVFSISEEQLAQPPSVPHGMNVNAGLVICFGLCVGIYKPVGHPAPYQDLIGEPLLSPTYMFGLRYRDIAASATQPQSNPWPIIATVSTQARDYQVTLLEVATVDGVSTYHLALKPLRKPKDNRLRELWVGTDDYLPRKAIISGNFTIAPLVDVPWVVDFAVVDGAPFVVRESAERMLYLSHRRVVGAATIAFENVGQPDDSIYNRPLLAPDATEMRLVEPGPG